MRQTLSILISTLILFQSMYIKASDILHMDDFISHIVEHARQGDNIFEFYQLHYGKKSSRHFPQDHHHKNLPLHGNFDINNTYIVYHSISKYCKLDTQNFYYSRIAYYHYINFYSFLESNKLTDPPVV